MKNVESTERPRKRIRLSEDGDEAVVASGGKKTRGRPRVDTQDATAADRRRTQIRLAQRAYRQRKETTISSLKQQSAQLHAIIEEMHKTFLRYHASVAKSGLLQLHPGLAKDVREMAETIANCVKSSNERTLDSDEDEFGSEETSAPKPMSDSQARPAMTTPENEQSSGYAATQQASELTQPEVTATQTESYLTHISSSSYNLPESNSQYSLVRGPSFTVTEVVDHPSSIGRDNQSRATDDRFQAQQQHQRLHHDQALPFGLIDIPSRGQSPFMPPYIFPVHIPAMGAELPPAPRYPYSKASSRSTSPRLTKTLSPTYTYSYEEVTFARRLVRATLELAFSLLSSPDVAPAHLQHIFRLSLPYLTLEELRTRIKAVLSRGVTEDLDSYATPSFHVGGAGTHFRRRDAQGRPIPTKNIWTARQIGPLDQRMIRLESIANNQTRDLEGVDLRGFEGEWFDAHDVQGYLEEQWHCKIDPRSSFAECLIDDKTSSPSDTETNSPSLSRSSTANTSDNASPPALANSAFESSYGLDMPFGNSSALNFFSPAPPKHNMLDLSVDQTLGLDLAPGFDMGFPGSGGYSTLGLDTMEETERNPVVRQRPKRVAWVDIQKLIDKMTKHAVCLGQVPGYRRKDVDAAFIEALIPAY